MGVENVIKKQPTNSILNNLKSTELIFQFSAKYNKRVILPVQKYMDLVQKL